MEYLHTKIINLFKKKESKEKFKIIFNIPKEEFRKMLEKEIIPHKSFSIVLGKEEVLRLMEVEGKDKVELNWGECADEINNNLSLEELEKE